MLPLLTSTLNIAPHRRCGARQQKRRQRGFTLLEAMFACLLLVFGFIPVLSVVALSQRLERQAQIRTVAYNVARTQMEALQARTWTNLPVTADTTFTIPASINNQLPYSGTASDPTAYRVQLTGIFNITQPDSTNANIRQISVLVRWRNAVNNQANAGRTSEVCVSTLVARQAL